MSNYITIKEFAKAINKSRVWVGFLIKSKRIKARKYQGEYKIAREELERYREDQAAKKRIEAEEDINEFTGVEEPKKKYWWRPKDPGSRSFFYPKSEAELKDEERQKNDIDYKIFKR